MDQECVPEGKRVLFGRRKALLVGGLVASLLPQMGFPSFCLLHTVVWLAAPDNNIQLFRRNHAHSKCLTNRTSSQTLEVVLVPALRDERLQSCRCDVTIECLVWNLLSVSS